MRVSFSGHRDRIASWWQIKTLLDFYNKDGKLIVVHGGAKGFDTQVSRVAKRLGIKEQVHLPNWDLFGKSAGYRRNITIVDASDILVVYMMEEQKAALFKH